MKISVSESVSEISITKQIKHPEHAPAAVILNYNNLLVKFDDRITRKKKIKQSEQPPAPATDHTADISNHQNPLYDVLKHVEFDDPINNKKKKKKTKQSPSRSLAAEVLTDENLLFEVLKHVDERTLGRASCVNKQWNRTVQDERLWELICTKHWADMACGNNQLRSVVLALGGFRKLHAHYLYPLSKSSGFNSGSCSSSAVAAAVSSSGWPCLKPGLVKSRWGYDEVQLSLSLLSVRYFEKISYRDRSN